MNASGGPNEHESKVHYSSLGQIDNFVEVSGQATSPIVTTRNGILDSHDKPNKLKLSFNIPQFWNQLPTELSHISLISSITQENAQNKPIETEVFEFTEYYENIGKYVNASQYYDLNNFMIKFGF